MTDLVLEYVLDGRRPGYNFTTPTSGYDPETLKTIWQQAMPRGQGWRDFIGARALKCFPLAGGRQAAISEVTVTDQADEIGRQGIRRAAITLLDGADFLDYLALRLALLPEQARQEATRRLSWRRWKQIMDRAAPKARAKAGQIVLAGEYSGPAGWQVMEAAVLLVATSQRVRALKGWPRVLPLTTLALDPRDESRLVALPHASLPRLNGIRPIVLE
ncbi:MAG: hypothetical protein JXN59_14755 [Anaerolineae bacterium]|nr:hypothetical protein [Anaerolineae bacterium]